MEELRLPLVGKGEGVESTDDQGLLIGLLRARMHRVDELLTELEGDVDAGSEATWEGLVFAGAELVSAYRAIVRSRGGSARDRILRYLQQHVGETIDGEVLASIAGISEWARRVRELDVEQGYRITTHENDSRLRPSEYRLESIEPDAERAAWWRLKRDLRSRRDLSPEDKAVTLLTRRVGQSVSVSDLQYAVGHADGKSVIHNLRNEGWRISSDLNRADLDPDECVLETDEQVPLHMRADAGTWEAVLRRDRYTCRKCRWQRTDAQTNGRVYLTVRPSAQHPRSLADFETVCNRCYDVSQEG